MNNLLYPKLAATNIQKHIRLYAPYIISAVITIAMFYVLGAITSSEDIPLLYGGSYLRVVLRMGWIVIGIFSLIFLLYTNSFLMKQRKTELGLYNVLGMEKHHIARIMFFETLFVSLLSIVLGLMFGIVFDKLTTLILCKILHFEVKLGFSISVSSVLITTVVFGVIFLISLFSNIRRVRKSNTIELIHSTSIGEKEPRTKWPLVVIGVLTLAFGYTIAIAVKSPLEALMLFFIAVICVIVGTYCLFMAGSIAVLKLMRRNKNYYYQPKHFNSVSGMLYRMKQNAVGLANICILSTMVLVMVSTTVSMYAATQDSLETRYPRDFDVVVKYEEDTQYMNALIENCVRERVKSCGRTMSNFQSLEYLSFATSRSGDTFLTDNNNYSSSAEVHEFCCVSAEQYEQLTGEAVELGRGEVAIFSSADQIGDSFELFNKTFIVKEHLDSFPSISNFSALLANIHYMVVADDGAMNELDLCQREAYGENSSSLSCNIKFDTDGTDEEKIACKNVISEGVRLLCESEEGDTPCYVDNKQSSSADFYGVNGSLLFLGIILGLLFLIVTVMIIYYKQVSEGYDDKHRFEIMQQVGMSKSEVKKSINNQILTVFFLPLVTAFIHLAFAFPIISRLMVVFNFTNTSVFVIGLLVTAVVFAIIYAVVYALTSRTYYKIVS